MKTLPVLLTPSFRCIATEIHLLDGRPRDFDAPSRKQYEKPYSYGYRRRKNSHVARYIRVLLADGGHGVSDEGRVAPHCRTCAKDKHEDVCCSGGLGHMGALRESAAAEASSSEAAVAAAAAVGVMHPGISGTYLEEIMGS